MLAPCEVDDAIPSSKETPPPLVALDCEPFKCCWNSEPTAPREEGAPGALFTGGTTTPVSESDEGASDEAVNTFDSAKLPVHVSSNSSLSAAHCGGCCVCGCCCCCCCLWFPMAVGGAFPPLAS